MQAIQDIRKHLVDNKALKLTAETLITFVENAEVQTAPGDSNYGGEDRDKNYKLVYDAVIYVLKFSGDIRYLCLIIGEWMNKNQPEKDIDAIKFDADILSHTESEFEFRLRLTEDVIVEESEKETRIHSEYGYRKCPVHSVILADGPTPSPNDYDINLVPSNNGG